MKFDDIKNYDDEQLLNELRSGNTEAEELLIQKYSKVVKACARPYFLIGGESEDLIQEGMLGLIAAIRQYSPDEGASFKTYAELCIKNRLFTAIKNAARLKHFPLNDYVSFQSPHFDESKTLAANSARNPEDLIILRERLSELLENTDKRFSKLESEVLRLYLEGQSYDEIAKAIGKSYKSVDNTVQRIRKKLAQFY